MDGGYAASLVHSHFEGNKRDVLRLCDSSGERMPARRRRLKPQRFRLKAIARQLEVGYALLQLHADGTTLAAAVVVCLVCNIRSRENLETKQKGNAHRGKKPSCSLAHSPELSKAQHLP